MINLLIFIEQIVITTALGFDSYLVMRHGSQLDENESCDSDRPGLKCISGSRLGCYFCNDVTAPGNVSRRALIDLNVRMAISFKAFTVAHSHIQVVNPLHFKMSSVTVDKLHT